MERVCAEADRFFTVEAARRGFEDRAGQQDMALDIVEALRDRQHIVVEAGVGIGKSFAYIVPLLLYHRRTRRPIVLSTSTIALQEQLRSDVQTISQILSCPVEMVLAKGQTHFVCKKRRRDFLNKGNNASQHSGLLTAAVERGDFPAPVADGVWNKINVREYSYKTCRQECPFSGGCHYLKLRDRMKNTSGIVICNHDLLTAHMQKTKAMHMPILPDNLSVIVVDEAHNLEEKVRSSLTLSYAGRQIRGIVDEARKALPPDKTAALEKPVHMLSKHLEDFYGKLRVQIECQLASNPDMSAESGRFYLNNSAETESHDREALGKSIRAIALLTGQISFYIGVHGIDGRRTSPSVRNAADDLEIIAEFFDDLQKKEQENLYWLERTGKASRICSCPKKVSEIINDLYFTGHHRTVLTSATITNQASGTDYERYSYFIKNTGFPTDSHGFVSTPKPSPFPYDKHAILYYSDNLPHPTYRRDDFIRQGTEEIIRLLEITHGKAMILFTAKNDLESVYGQLSKRNLPYNLLVQDNGSSQNNVLQRFKRDTNSVLLGTGAFWEGVSVEGASLSNLIIFRLPFPVPDPIIDYKRAQSKDPLMEVTVPEMIIKLKQGVGRLIRSETDAGIVSILDPRLGERHRAPYRNLVWEALPIKNRTSDLTVVRSFFYSLQNVGDEIK